MFEIGDKVVSMSNGICCITGIVEMDMSGNGMKKYYTLVPESDHGTKLFIPVESAAERIRKTMDKTEAMNMLEHIRDLGKLVIEDEKDREKKYKEALRSSDPNMLAAALKSIYYRRKQREAEGKKSTVVDDKYYKLTIHKLHSELAYALGCSESDIMGMIHERLD